jgi:hypothetical protein
MRRVNLPLPEHKVISLLCKEVCLPFSLRVECGVAHFQLAAQVVHRNSSFSSAGALLSRHVMGNDARPGSSVSVVAVTW